MGRNKDSYINLLKKICKKNYPNLIIDRIECVETNKFDYLTNSWIPDGHTIFISTKNNHGYNIFEVENFIESVLGAEIVISIH
jgi:hypothetical protein